MAVGPLTPIKNDHQRDRRTNGANETTPNQMNERTIIPRGPRRIEDGPTDRFVALAVTTAMQVKKEAERTRQPPQPYM